MKTKTFLLLSCFIYVYGIEAQQNVGISMGPSYMYDIYYSLENGITETVERTNWELAFSTNAYETNIRINSGNAVALYEVSTDITAWNTTTNLSSNAIQLRNSNSDWAQGAFVVNQNGALNYGWGDYNMTTHIIEGSRIYVITYGANTKKMIINSLEMGAYTFTIANLDGSDEEQITLDVNQYNNKKFIYYSLENMEVVDREPVSNSWDLLFTKYEDDLQNDEANPLNYDQAYYVTGVLSNGNLMAQYQGSVSDNYSMLELDTTRNINTIGFDWKQYSGSYVMTPELSYYVADRNDQIVYKIIFTSFDGQSNGNLSFNLSEVEELMNVTENYTSNQLNIFPNPSKGLLFLDIDSSNPVNVTVKNISGQTIRTEILDESNWLDLSDQIQGLYIIHVSGKDINSVKKVSILK